MPLQPAYSWSETETSIKISIDNIPIKDRGQLFCSDRLVKLNVHPYLLLLDLKHAVDDGASTATIIKGRKIVINLIKAEPGPWQKLVADGAVAVIRKQREESVQRAHQKLLAAQQQKQDRKHAEERAAVDLSIQQQKAQRDQLEAFKQQELQEERQELQQWQQELQDQGDESDYEEEPADAAAQVISHHDQQACAQGSTAAPGYHSSGSSSTEEAYHGRGWWPSKAADTSSADPSECAVTGSGSNDNSSSSSSSSPRSGALQHLTASPAHTAADACQAVTTLLDSAASGPSTADEPFITTSSTRRLSAGPSPHTESRQTSTAAAPGTTSSTDSTSSKPSRPVAPVRSRVAPVPVTFTQLETPHLPAREQREVEIKQIKKAAGKADSLDVADRQPAFLKDKGDAFAAQGNYMGAVNAYSKALELDPTQASLWANRAAAHLALGQAAECVQDCSTAIELVEQAHTKALQAVPGTAAELELQAGMMLGAASASDGAAARTSAAASAEEQQQPEPSSNDSSDGPVAAAEVARASSGEEASQGGTEANADDKALQVGSDAQQHGCSSIIVGGCSSGSSTLADSDSSFSAGAQTVMQAEQLPDASMAAKLQQLLVKLFARKAAAHVELQQLQEAADGLQHALRLDPNSHRLQADALEVSLALNPDSSLDPAAIKELAAARFKAGDLAGAAEAFTALAELLQQQQQQDQAEGACGPEEQQEGGSNGLDEQQQQQRQQRRLLLAGALSNQAACRLGLNMHAECVQDCWAAFRALWPAAADSSAAGLPDQPGGSSEASPSSRLEQHPPSRLLQLTGSRAAAQSAARTVGRLAAAYGCLKDVPAADAAFGWAAACWRLLGEHARVEGVLADQARLHQPQQQPK